MASPLKLTLEGETHSVIIGYVSWLFGVFGAHRFYYGRKLTGILWFFTLGLLGIGWIVDLFLIPSMNATACRRYVPGRIDYSMTWVLFAFLGIFGIHHFYMGQVITGVVWLLTGGLCGLGLVYDLVTLNEQISDVNAA